MHFITLTFHWYFKPGSSSPRASRLVEVTRHFLLLGCCPCNQVGKTKAFQRKKTVNFNLALIQVEKYMEKFPYCDLPRCKIVFSFGIHSQILFSILYSWSFTWDSSALACCPSLHHQHTEAQHVIAGQMPTVSTLLL